MNLPKRILALLLVAVMCIAPMAVLTLAEGEADGSSADTAASSEATSEQPIVLPSSVTLVGTEHLPPIMNQGGVGCCASAAITYMQFTNAVSRYLHSVNPDIEWNPSSGDDKYIFAPKFTYQYSGAGTAWVYDLIKDHGCLTKDKCNFETDRSGGLQIKKSGSRVYEKSASYEVGKGLLKDALSYRISNYEQIWLTSTYKKDGKVAVTTTEQGQKLITKIKEALYGGNVVVTGGYPSRWQTVEKLATPGTLAKSTRESAIIYSTGDAAGGHQVSIVGYDDDITVKVSGITLKGAFLVANSWDTTWMNNGYVWMMYDALNEVSEFEKLNVRGRTWTMDQMCFLYWDKDLLLTLPDLMIEYEADTTDRESGAIFLLRRYTDENGKTIEDTYKPTMFEYGPIDKNCHDSYDTGKNYTYSGKVSDGKTTEKGYFSISLDGFLATMKKGTTFADYEWGVRMYSVNGAPTTFTNVKLVTKDGKVLATLDTGADGIYVKAEKSSKSEKKYFEFSPASPVLPEGEHFTAELTSPDLYLIAGDSYSFKLTAEEGFTLKDATVSLNGNALTPDENGVYTVSADKANLLSVEGVAEDPGEAPEDPNGTNSGSKWILFAVIGGVVVIAAVVIAVVAVSKKKKA